MPPIVMESIMFLNINRSIWDSGTIREAVRNANLLTADPSIEEDDKFEIF